MKESSTTRGYSSLYFNPLNDLRHCRSCSSDYVRKGDTFHFEDQIETHDEKENARANANGSSVVPKPRPKPLRSLSTDRILKPSSLEFCMQMNDHNSNSLNVWDYSDSESAPASSWSALPNRSLICRPLPLDIGRCTCFILKEPTPQGLSGGTFFSLYTNEGQGRQNRKLAVAHHKRRNGRSHFTVAQNVKGLLSHSDDNTFLGTVTANLIGSKYHIWDQGYRHNSRTKQPKPPLAVVTYIPTITTCTGSHRSMKAYIPNHQSMSLKNPTQLQHIKGLTMNWEGKLDKVHQLFSRVPLYNKISKQYELDFRDKAKAGLRIQRSVKNFQLTLGENGRQTILQLGRVGKSKFVMDYRYPLTGYQAFCICLASMDAKLCCTL
ncbi:Tubby protein 8 [Spatholobus suberectus]|nr:Tubby protein 8 [Spatholobus suberectus]